MELQHAVGMDKEAFRKLWEKLFPGMGVQFGPFGGVIGIRSLGEGVRYYNMDEEPNGRIDHAVVPRPGHGLVHDKNAGIKQ